MSGVFKEITAFWGREGGKQHAVAAQSTALLLYLGLGLGTEVWHLHQVKDFSGFIYQNTSLPLALPFLQPNGVFTAVTALPCGLLLGDTGGSGEWRGWVSPGHDTGWAGGAAAGTGDASGSCKVIFWGVKMSYKAIQSQKDACVCQQFY